MTSGIVNLKTVHSYHLASGTFFVLWFLKPFNFDPLEVKSEIVIENFHCLVWECAIFVCVKLFPYTDPVFIKLPFASTDVFAIFTKHISEICKLVMVGQMFSF
jgi:hypothetical protein